MKHAIISGTGSYLPKRQLSNTELEQHLDTSHEWIMSRTGIASRHISEADNAETTSMMAAMAAEKALKAAQIDKDHVDLVLAATCTPDKFFPGTACYVKHHLNMNRPIPAFDVGAACSGFLYALDIAKQYIASGTCQHVLVIGSERMTHAVNWQDRSTCVLFGDGAGALVLSASDTPGILASKIHAAYDQELLLHYANRSSYPEPEYIQMRGNEVFKIAVNIMGDIVEEILSENQLKKSDLTWLIPHQANIRIIQAIAKKLQMPMSQVIVTIENQGNTSAASIPIALDHAVSSKKVKRGDLILLEAFGGGMTWGAALIRF